MQFYISNIKIDRSSYWNNQLYNSAPYLNFANTVFEESDSFINYTGSEAINTSFNMESNCNTARNLPCICQSNGEYLYPAYSFTYFNAYSKVNFYSKKITINPGTEFRTNSIVNMNADDVTIKSNVIIESNSQITSHAENNFIDKNITIELRQSVILP